MKKYIREMRLKQWVKNLLIFLPIVCSKSLTSLNIMNTIIGFFSFGFMASTIYIINDIIDLEKDRNSERKRNRPIASGDMNKKGALVLALLCLAISLSLNFLIKCSNYYVLLGILLLYMVINILYTFGLKNVEIIDIMLLAIGFILRVYYGAAIVNVEVSDWLFLTIMNGALFLAIGKRKKELQNEKQIRESLKKYNLAFLDKFQYVCLGLMLVFYSLWTMEQATTYLIFTILLVMLIIMRYCLILENEKEGDPTTILYDDKIILCLFLLYIMVILSLELINF